MYHIKSIHVILNQLLWYGFSLCFLSMLLGCDSGGYQSELKHAATHVWTTKDIPAVEQLIGVPMQQSDQIGKLAKIFLFEDRYLAYTSLGPDAKVRIYDLLEAEWYDTAPEGKGPGECLFPMHLSYDPIKRHLWITDGTTRRLLCYSLDSALMRRPLARHSLKEIPLDSVMGHYTFWLNDTTFMVGETSHHGRFSFINHEGKLIAEKKSVFPPKMNAQISDEMHARIFEGRYIPNQIRTHWMIAGRRSDWIEIYDSEWEFVMSSFGPDHVVPVTKTINVAGYTSLTSTKETTTPWAGVGATDKHFYLLYAGRRRIDTPKDAPDSWYYSGKDVFVMNLEGRVTQHYKLDRDVVEIKVTSTGDVLYAIDDNIPDIIRYELPQ